MRNEGEGSALLDDLNTARGHDLDREKRLQELQQATMGILVNLAETDNLPWAVQMSLLNIISTTGIQAGAIKLNSGEDYVFAAQERIDDFDSDISLGCRFGRDFKLFAFSKVSFNNSMVCS